MAFSLILADEFGNLKKAPLGHVLDGDKPTSGDVYRMLGTCEGSKMRCMVKNDLRGIIRSMETAAKKNNWKYVLLTDLDHVEGAE